MGLFLYWLLPIERNEQKANYHNYQLTNDTEICVLK